MDAISAEEKQAFQDILSQFFGKQAYQWNINIRVLTLLETLLRKNKTCSQYMDLIPRPFYVGNVIKWASKQARQAVLKHLNNGGKHYVLCAKGAAIGMRSQFQIAAMGL